MEKTKVIKKVDLQITSVVVQAVIPTHTGVPPSRAGDDFGGQQDRKVTFIVNTKTWECEGKLATNDPVLADEAWWANQCQRVSDRVRTQIKSTAA